MRVALAAQYLGAIHIERRIDLRADVLGRDGRPETRPARVRIELGLRTEERVAATDAAIYSYRGPFVILVVEGRFGACVACHLVLLGREQFAPFSIALDHLGHRDRALPDAGWVELDYGDQCRRTRCGRVRTGPFAKRPACRKHHRHSDRYPQQPPPRKVRAATIVIVGVVHHSEYSSNSARSYSRPYVIAGFAILIRSE